MSFALMATRPCVAQFATLTATHNDLDGLVVPGETVRIRASVAKLAGARFLWEVKGDLVSAFDVGHAANNRFPGGLIVNPGAILNMGTVDGGSVRGVHIQVYDQWALSGTLAPWPPWSYPSVNIVEYDWTAPSTPGVVDFNWQPSPDLPEVWYALAQIWTIGPVPTTYVGASLTVVPAPAWGVLLVCGSLAASRRRRVGA